MPGPGPAQSASLCSSMELKGSNESEFEHGAPGSYKVMLMKIGGQNKTLKYLDMCYVGLQLLSWVNQAAGPQMLRAGLLIPIAFSQKLGANRNSCHGKMF